MADNGRVAIVTGAGQRDRALQRDRTVAGRVFGRARGAARGCLERVDRGSGTGRRTGSGRVDGCRRCRFGRQSVRRGEGEIRTARRAVQQCGDGRAAGAARGSDPGTVADGGRRQPDRFVPVHPASVPDHEGPDADGRSDHQQRFDLGPRAAAEFRALHRDQARDHRINPVDRAGRPQNTTSRRARSISAMR